MSGRGKCKWRYAYVDGVKSLPDKGLHGVCRGCRSPMISKCGHFVVDHWAHKPGYGTDCTLHYEGIGPWHKGWQDLVQDEYAEVEKPPHWADIVTLDGLVIELQHSPISVETIAEREAFYEDMIWVFEATNRFEMITVGRRTFFSLKKTRHLAQCTKPVFLDFGSVVVEVETFSRAVAKLHGFGRTRSREWFAQQYLAGILKDSAILQDPQPGQACRWSTGNRYSRTSQTSLWNDPETAEVVTIPEDSICLPLDWYFTRPGEPRVNEWERILDSLPALTNDWKKDELVVMQRFLNGEIVILDGFLRVLPASSEHIDEPMTVAVTEEHLARLDEHIKAGRIPILEATFTQQLIERAKAYERREFGDLLANLRRDKTNDEQQRRLF